MAINQNVGTPPYIVNPAFGNKHNISRSLRIMARNQGWDPDAIVDMTTGEKVGDVSKFNLDPDTMWHRGVGQLPEGIKDSYPEFDAPDVAVPGRLDFQIPDVARENADNRSSGADPFPTGSR